MDITVLNGRCKCDFFTDNHEMICLLLVWLILKFTDNVPISTFNCTRSSTSSYSLLVSWWPLTWWNSSSYYIVLSTCTMCVITSHSESRMWRRSNCMGSGFVLQCDLWDQNYPNIIWIFLSFHTLYILPTYIENIEQIGCHITLFGIMIQEQTLGLSNL